MQSFSGTYFPAFGLNTDQKNSKYGHFSHNEYIHYFPVLKIDIKITDA